MESASYFSEKAAQCRRLAAEILTRGDPSAKAILALAVEFEAKAAAHEARAKAACGIGKRNSVIPMPPEDRQEEEWR